MEVSLGITTVIVTAIPSHAASSVILMTAPSMLLLSNAKTCRLVDFEIRPKEVLQVGRFLHLLGKISLVRQGRIMLPFPSPPWRAKPGGKKGVIGVLHMGVW